MSERISAWWHWFWRERRGLLLLPKIRGAGRLVVDVPLTFAVLLLLYRWFSTLPEPEKHLILWALENPFMILAILLMAAHEFGVRYLRDQLVPEVRGIAKAELAIPGRILRLYRKQHGIDWNIRAIWKIRMAALASGGIGLILFHRLYLQMLVGVVSVGLAHLGRW